MLAIPTAHPFFCHAFICRSNINSYIALLICYSENLTIKSLPTLSFTSDHITKQHSNCRHPQQVGRDYMAHQMASQLDPPTEVHKHSEQTQSWTRPSSTLLGSSKSTTNRPRSLWTHDAEDGASRRCSMQLWWSQADGRTCYKLLPRHKVLWWLSCLGQGSNRLVAQTEHWYIKLSSSNRIRTNEHNQNTTVCTMYGDRSWRQNILNKRRLKAFEMRCYSTYGEYSVFRWLCHVKCWVKLRHMRILVASSSVEPSYRVLTGTRRANVSLSAGANTSRHIHLRP